MGLFRSRWHIDHQAPEQIHWAARRGEGLQAGRALGHSAQFDGRATSLAQSSRGGLPGMPAWSKKFWKPIVLRDGRELATLADARDLMLALPERHQSRPLWQYAAELLIDAAERSS